MNSILQIFLALLGTALLGSIIGWFARRIIAIRDERSLHQEHAQDMDAVKDTLAITDNKLRQEQQKSAGLDEEIVRLNGEAVRLEQAALQSARLDETLVASNLELAEARNRNQILTEQYADQQDELRRIKEELNTQRFIARNARNSAPVAARANPDLLFDTASAQSVHTSQAHDGVHTSRLAGEQQRPSQSAPPGFYDDEDQVSDIDQDIADMTADIMGLMIDEPGDEIMNAESSAPVGDRRTSGPPSADSGGVGGFFSNFGKKKIT